jgi:hypothetical protein
MSLDGDHLLKRLQPVVRPCGLEFEPRGGTPSGSGDFARLIELAAAGELVSGRPVSHQRSTCLDRSELDQLSRACDALESAGIEHGAVLMNERTFLIDVATRVIQRELGPEDQGRVHTLGGIVRMLSEEKDGEKASETPAHLPRRQAISAVPPGVLAQLERGGPLEG